MNCKVAIKMGMGYNKGKYAYRLNAAMYQICHCEAVGRGNLQHRSVMTYEPINIENLGFTMLIG